MNTDKWTHLEDWQREGMAAWLEYKHSRIKFNVAVERLKVAIVKELKLREILEWMTRRIG